MLKTLSIKELYTLALAEGEGVGTAYEYFAKRLVLSWWLAGRQRPSHLLIAGLPEKYGVSLDFLQLAAELATAVTIVDERPAAIARLHGALAAAQDQGWLTTVQLTCFLVSNIALLSEIDEKYDLVLSSEVLQRVSADNRAGYMAKVAEVGTAVALFTPNADNPAHTNLSGLAGLHLQELQDLIGRANVDVQSGYIDMPPFPPGITRDEEQRAQATSGKLEAIAMWGLGNYAHLEKILPHNLRQRHSHIVYALLTNR